MTKVELHPDQPDWNLKMAPTMRMNNSLPKCHCGRLVEQEEDFIVEKFETVYPDNTRLVHTMYTCKGKHLDPLYNA